MEQNLNLEINLDNSKAIRKLDKATKAAKEFGKALE